MSKKVLITGITGQDGSYLAEFLLKKNYQVFGLTRRTSTSNYDRIKNIVDEITLVSGDLLDQYSMANAIAEIQPDEIYNLAAQSFVPTSWSQPVLTGEFTALGVTRILEAIKNTKPDAKFYQASSSEMFGKVRETPQTETTPFYPRSPYGVAKVYGHWITVNYRESFNLFAISGILFNHESPRRGLEFVTRKITHAVARIKFKKQTKLQLGNLESKRDWGYAPDYVEAMWLMLQQDKPDDFVIATGQTWSVKDFAKLAFEAVGLNWQDYVEVDKKFVRPAEVDLLVGDASKAKKQLNWRPKTSFKEMVKIMVEADLKIEKAL
ncbi:MAG: GDP-mannose 4,6-dehydratase [Candidatus Beckwithbacteria bacterium]